MFKRKTILAFVLSVMLLMVFAVAPVSVMADSGITKHNSNRYFQNASGTPTFLLGYYTWPAIDPAKIHGGGGDYRVFINNMQANHLNYMRVSLGINRDSSVGNPTPFYYNGSKFDLSQWDASFWTDLHTLCQYAKDRGVYVQICLFDGVDFRAGTDWYRWVGSFWNVDNQTQSFYGDLDTNNNGDADASGEFYRLADFTNNTGIGYYQKKLIDKATSEMASYDNVFYEVGNELLGAPSDWNNAVIGYIKTKTSRAVTQTDVGSASNKDGWCTHNGNTPAAVKAWVASNVGQGYPAWTDPDGSALTTGSADDLRRAAWYSLAGGAAAWGGYNDVDYGNGGSGDTAKLAYYKYLADFVANTGIPFWQMMPNQGIISNNTYNSCLASSGSNYLAYVLSDSSVTINLAPGSYYYKTYDTKTGALSAASTCSGSFTFSRPSGASDWAVYVYPDTDGTTPTQTTINDNTTGTGANQFEYAGSWVYENTRPNAYSADEHWSNTTGNYIQFRFTGTEIKFYSSKAADMGKADFSVDGGSATTCDFYSGTQAWQQLIYDSGILSSGNHTLKILLSGQKNASSSGYYVCADDIVIGSGTSTPPPALISNMAVKDTGNASDWSVRSNIQSGDLEYGDRTFTFTSVPSGIAGSDWIRTANDSKAYTADPVITFTVTADADVYVAHNDAITAKPSWLTGWTDTGMDIINNEASPKTFSLYKKSFASGSQVSLGNNGDVNAGMYTVIVKASGGTSILGNNSPGTTTDYAGACDPVVWRCKANSSFTATKMFINIDTGIGSGNTMKMCIYADSNGTPGALLGETGARSGVGTGWQQFNLTSPVSINSGTYYWLGSISDANYLPVYRNDTNADPCKWYGGTSMTLPNPFVISGSYTGRPCFYAAP